MVAEYEEKGVESKLLDGFFFSSSSLGGARPKLNVVDDSGNLFIAKIPSRTDDYDVALWEKLVLDLASKCSIKCAESSCLMVGGRFHSLLSRRFDRKGESRIHIASAWALMKKERRETASFVDLAELVSIHSVCPEDDLSQLYRRLVFFAYVNNTDNHLRNHSFILSRDGWRLAPMYDVNPSFRGRASALPVDENVPDLDLEAIRETSVFYGLDAKKARAIEEDVAEAVSHWRSMAYSLGLSADIALMENAFLV